MVRITTLTCFLLVIVIMATSGNARSASNDVDVENSAMELKTSLRDDVEMYRRDTCAVFGAYCNGNFFTSARIACCGSSNLYCDRSLGLGVRGLNRRAATSFSGSGDALSGSVQSSLNDILYGLSSGHCVCKDGLVPTTDGRDCTSRTCVRHSGGYCDDTTPCCGGGNLYCDKSINNCVCKPGTVPNSHGTDCDSSSCVRQGGRCGPCCGSSNLHCSSDRCVCKPGTFPNADGTDCGCIAVGLSCGTNGKPNSGDNFGCCQGLVCWAADLKCHASG